MRSATGRMRAAMWRGCGAPRSSRSPNYVLETGEATWCVNLWRRHFSKYALHRLEGGRGEEKGVDATSGRVLSARSGASNCARASSRSSADRMIAAARRGPGGSATATFGNVCCDGPSLSVALF
jgi:hypothetical protein